MPISDLSADVWSSNPTPGMGSLAWPFSLATAAVAALLSADAVARPRRSQSPAARMGASYAAAFIGFKLGILAWVALLDHGWSAFSGEVLLRQFLRYGAIFAGLLAVQVLLARAGFGLGMPANEPKPQAA